MEKQTSICNAMKRRYHHGYHNDSVKAVWQREKVGVHRQQEAEATSVFASVHTFCMERILHLRKYKNMCM